MNLLFLGASNTDCGHCFTSDNLGEGFVKLTYERLSVICRDKCRILSFTNGGTDGFTFPRIYQKWKTAYQTSSYDAAVILGGINEAGVIQNTALSPSQSKEYIQFSSRALTDLLLDLSHHGISHIFLLEPFLFPCPAYLELWIPTLEEIRTMIQDCINRYTGTAVLQYIPTQQELSSLAAQKGIDAVTTDGIHLTQDGHRCLSELLIPYLIRLFA